MPHLLIAGKLHPAGLALLEGRDGFTYDYVEEVSEPSYVPLIGKADALVIRTQPMSGLSRNDPNEGPLSPANERAWLPGTPTRQLPAKIATDPVGHHRPGPGD